MNLPAPIEKPKTRALKKMARMFMAGPEYKKAVAGPRPAPSL
ncbi:hypothetical protein ES703_98835 [subsurface metagenome]